MTDSLRVVYILLHFPYLTETFVAEEIRSLRAQGVDVQIVSLLEAGSGPAQQVSQQLQPHCQYAPGLAAWELWQAQIYYLFTAGKRYWSLLFTLFFGISATRSPALIAKRLVIFLKAVTVAYRLRNTQFALLHAHFAWLPGAAAWICAELLRKPFTVTTHAYDLYASTDLLALVAQKAAHVVTISAYNKNYLVTDGVCAAAKIAVIHCGINLEQFAPLVSEAVPATRSPLIARPLRIISVGSLNHKKGHRYLISACQHLKAHNLPFICTIIGSGGEEAKLRGLIDELNLQQEVKLLGALTNHEVIELYLEHDIFVLAAVVAPNGDRDGIPVVMIEAGAQGLPLVSTTVSGIPELAQPNQTGLLVPPENAEALASAILHLANHPELCRQYGKNAQQLVHAEFNITHCTHQLSNIFQHVANSSSADA